MAIVEESGTTMSGVAERRDRIHGRTHQHRSRWETLGDRFGRKRFLAALGPDRRLPRGERVRG